MKINYSVKLLLSFPRARNGTPSAHRCLLYVLVWRCVKWLQLLLSSLLDII